MLALGRMTMSEFALKLAEEQIGILREALLESEAENAELKRGIAEVRKSDCERNYAYGEVDWSPIDALLTAEEVTG